MGALSNGYGTYFLKYALSNALLNGVALRHGLTANKITARWPEHLESHWPMGRVMMD